MLYFIIGCVEFEEVNVASATCDSTGDMKAVSGAVGSGASNCESKPLKREGNASQWEAKGAKQSRRTTSLLNLFMSNSQGMSCPDYIL